MHLCYACNANFHESLQACPACGGKRYARVAGSVPPPSAAPVGPGAGYGLPPLSALPPVAPPPNLLGSGFWCGLGLLVFGANLLPMLGSGGLSAPALGLLGIAQMVLGVGLLCHQTWADLPGRVAAGVGAVLGVLTLASVAIYGPMTIMWYGLVAVLGGISLALYRYEEQAAHWSWLLMGLVAAAGLRLVGLGVLWSQGALHPDAYWRGDLANRVPAPTLLTPGKDGAPVYHDDATGCTVRMPAGWAAYTREQMFTLTGPQQMFNRHREAEAPQFACDPGDPRLIMIFGKSLWAEGKLADQVDSAREETASSLSTMKDDRDVAVTVTIVDDEEFKTDGGLHGHLRIFTTPDGRRHFMYLVQPEAGTVLILEGIDLGSSDAQRVFDGIAGSVTADPSRKSRRKEFTLPDSLPQAPAGGRDADQEP